MEENLYELATTQGIWALLSIILIFYILKAQEKRDAKQEEREKSYQNIIATLNDKLDIVEDIRTGVNEIKNYIKK
ncbi:BhlA/UviB family holin-like peptide [Sedimentibacter sp. MB31-C6]|uniref:BhlA/UviB family holin-like peptide n=1 Tax=Sedimentibacter sp. MB31-C6 TaxID=3109366 RepID=UPI002DDDB5CF|nr:BhlA/UviB family holin-like peptide [Sedimentibacter sp. MB36-C1]WSI04597.1 BhlA/UviB family holin-like peptide [Sedimentibacter sp. MB36-C1]